MLQRIGQYFEHLIIAMIKGFIFMGIAAVIVIVGAFLLIAHRMPTGGVEVVLIVLVVGLSALLGAAIGLVYRLTHIEEITHGVQHLVRSGDDQSTR